MGFEDSHQGNIIVDQKQVLKIWEIYVEELYDQANPPENLNVEPKVDEDHKGPHILCSEVETAIKTTRDKMATGDDDVNVEALKLLGDDDLNLLTHMISNMYETEEWPKDFTKVTMVALKKPKARKSTDHLTISLIAHAARVVASVIRSEKKIGEDQFAFRKGTRGATGMLRIISERTLDIGEEICVRFIDWKKASDRVKCTKVMKILKKTGTDWRERRLIRKLYIHQCYSVARPRDDKVSRLEEELEKGAVCYHFYSIYIVNMLPRKLTG
jgi:hypothetical protein